MRLWIDVEDMFQYAAHVKRPSGIQRLAFELQRALMAKSPEEVFFLRRGDAGVFTTIAFAAVEALFAGLSGLSPKQSSERRPVQIFKPKASPGIIHRGMAALPENVQEPARRLRIKLFEAGQALVDLTQALRPLAKAGTAIRADGPDFYGAAVEGDWLLVLGSPWSQTDYAERVQTQCLNRGLRFAFLMCDIIPLRRPEWCDPHLRRAFSKWFHSVAPLAETIFAISNHTASDIEHYAVETGLVLRSRVQAIPLGSGFGIAPLPARTPRLPPRRSFALIVATIEARKNHILLFRIWRELLNNLPFEKIPTLVFAGRVGWLVQDLMQQLENTAWLNGKIIHIESPSDSELAALYEDCLFTLFPSFYEGWGLPVTESLVNGAPCLASNRTSLAEAGGNFARYFDPDNLADAVRVVLEAIETPAKLQIWRDQIAAEFQPVPWSRSASFLFDALSKSAIV